MKNTVIALTGGVGSGKSRILQVLTEGYGARVIQTDLVARKLQEPGEPGYEALVNCFGQAIVGEDGRLQKEALARMLFENKEDRNRINGLIHPLVWNRVKQWTGEQEDREGGLLIVESAILPQNPGDFFHEIWYVYTLKEERIKRLMDSRGYSRKKCLQMMEAQPSEEEYQRQADFVIDNNGTPEQVRQQIRGRLGPSIT